ncbi:MAG: hypothetical protein EOO07_27620 [Chitinophagaceae bacterium]|nr:MAG: hypothetical protein EOO07_27620 [Chitinophagaceae bacterium]
MTGRLLLPILFMVALAQGAQSQVTDTLDILPKTNDTLLRIKNLNPYFTLHVDSTLRYQLEINKKLTDYYWFLKNSPVGLKINKDNGLLTFKAEKSFFLSGRLKYDYEYKVNLSVQNLDNPQERVDTSFTLLFYSTEIIASKVKPTVTKTMYVDEGDTISFKIQCDNGSFPIEEVTYISNYPVKSQTPVVKCGDDFTWYAPFDFIKESDKEKTKKLELYIVGSTKFQNNDTARIEIIVKENINYPQQVLEFQRLQEDTRKYVTSLKSSFRLVDKKIKKVKRTRTGFDLGSATTTLSGTIMSSLDNESQKTAGKILPSVGVALVPVKEAAAPNSTYEQNTATLIRSSIKRLEYLLQDNQLSGTRDPEILTKSRKLKDELKQMQIQLIDIPYTEEYANEQELDAYFNNPKVNKKYKPKNTKK